MLQAIRIHPQNPKYFEFRGKPLALVTATEHYGAVMNRPFRYDRYLADAADKHMTLTRLFCLFRELQTPVNPYSTCKPESPDYVAPFRRTGPGRALDGEPRYDLDQYNPEFFNRFHGFLSQASELSIIVEVVLFSNTYEPRVWSLNPLHGANSINAVPEIEWMDYTTMRHRAVYERQADYVRKLVQEANRYDNIIFEICNEPCGGFHGAEGAPSQEEVDAWQKAIAGIVRETEETLPLKHLISGHEACNYNPWTHAADKSFSSLPFDIVNMHPLPGIEYQSKRYEMGHFMSKELCLRALRDFCLDTYAERKPLNLDEDNIASEYKDVEAWTIHRKRAWTALMSGAHYDYIDFSIINYCETGTPQSREHIRSWMKHLSRFVHSLDLPRTAPRRDLLKEQPPHTCASVLAVADTGLCIYLADERERDQPGAGEPITGHVTLDLPNGKYRVAHFAPATGLYSPWLPVEGGPGTHLLLEAFEHDIVVRIVKD